ncbi:hypothetical protein CRG98_043470 [Punica granatum]|uniref:Uncharacterized protein n=1 Tax=Punica granatum TaxID=22663 RepID=A0A2I0HWP7_PUNGR|nr:hypothetical protein CRG98_043470 [Punica granatum]
MTFGPYLEKWGLKCARTVTAGKALGRFGNDGHAEICNRAGLLSREEHREGNGRGGEAIRRRFAESQRRRGHGVTVASVLSFCPLMRGGEPCRDGEDSRVHRALAFLPLPVYGFIFLVLIF